MSEEAIIQVRDLCNRFGDHAVHEHLDLDVRRGEILGVVGGSGTGKSVLLRAIIGLRRPQEGQIHVFGQNLLELPPEQRSKIERRFGVLFQNGALFSSLTVSENVCLPLIEHAGLSRDDAEYLAKVKISLAGLPPEAGAKYPSELSGGEKQRVAIARALAKEPELLFADEPTSALDAANGQTIIDILHTIAHTHGTTVLCVSHDPRLVAHADRVLAMEDGRILSDRRPDAGVPKETPP